MACGVGVAVSGSTGPTRYSTASPWALAGAWAGSAGLWAALLLKALWGLYRFASLALGCWSHSVLPRRMRSRFSGMADSRGPTGEEAARVFSLLWSTAAT